MIADDPIIDLTRELCMEQRIANSAEWHSPHSMQDCGHIGSKDTTAVWKADILAGVTPLDARSYFTFGQVPLRKPKDRAQDESIMYTSENRATMTSLDVCTGNGQHLVSIKVGD